MTTGAFHYLNRASLPPNGGKPWAKVDGPGHSFTLKPYTKPVTNIRTVPDAPRTFTTDTSGWSYHTAPTTLTHGDFDNDTTIRSTYYDETTALLRQHMPSGAQISHVEIFDHTIRRHNPTAARQPVQQVHVDQTPRAAAARVRRHLPPAEAERLLRGRYQIVNVWRPIGHAASDYPLGVIDWRSTKPEDFVKVDLMYPLRKTEQGEDDRGKEVLPDKEAMDSTVGYEARGETLVVGEREGHRWYYVKDMRPEEVMLLKCFDSRSEWMADEGYVSGGEGESVEGDGREGVAMGTPHTAFIDPDTPEGVKGRESIEVRCLVFYDD